ncbi:MAG: prolyl oligopeptidase family serine peptidase [Deltaproteobacteria bacterium]|nr:prolyl oligopeptidase family serine peptidase [Deltaproteobacteria bacterium]MCB9478588.1 prolyl oligopeptidase family serine peptidase [Deltaproteobacteria bacterium]MCB9488328.1 prolyl oligopeptidase family serine peptidase [Deltaproteobacteria bacterium]
MQRRYLIGFLVLALGALFSFVAACGDTEDATFDDEGNLIAGDHELVYKYDGIERSYLVHIPPQIEDASKGNGLPVIVALHGGGMRAEQMSRYTSLNARGDELGIIILYPEGTGLLGEVTFWNAGNCCGKPMEDDVDDVGFILNTIKHLSARSFVDFNRLYATGISNGGMMAYRLACEVPEVFAGIAPVSGALNFDGCDPSTPISVIAFHGTDDERVPYDGGEGTTDDSELLTSDTDNASVEDSLEVFRDADNCESTPEIETSGVVELATWSCDDETVVARVKIEGGEHEWPVDGEANWLSLVGESGGDANLLMWNFFQRNERPDIDTAGDLSR